jgi:two-component system, NtrC family, response regulator GlrR
MDMLSCGVISAGVPELLCRGICDELYARAEQQIRLLWQPGPIELAGCDFVVLPVQAATLSRALGDIGRLRSLSPASSIIAVCFDLEPEQIAALLGAGAFDFVATPDAGNELLMRMQRAAGLLQCPPIDQGPAVLEMARAHGLIGSSACFVEQLKALPVFADCDASVSILGETGTGKEVFARAIHYLSSRASRPMVAVNCGAIPTELVETELFGCVRGAYTSANAARSGLVREAEGGTLFLDEIDSLPLSAQIKLLRFLQEKEYRPVGGKVCRADVRIITASNRDLVALSEHGLFRSDLYFRLNVLSMTLPPLRDRHDDIPELARHFVAQCCRQRRRAAADLAPQAMRKLQNHCWPGNVRELHNVVERSVLFCTGAVINAEDLQLPGDTAREIESFREAKARTVEAFERNYIEKMLAMNAGNITHAAQDAGKNRRAFFALMRKYAIAAERFRMDRGMAS